MGFRELLVGRDDGDSPRPDQIRLLQRDVKPADEVADEEAVPVEPRVIDEDRHPRPVANVAQQLRDDRVEAGERRCPGRHDEHVLGLGESDRMIHVDQVSTSGPRSATGRTLERAGGAHGCRARIDAASVRAIG